VVKHQCLGFKYSSKQHKNASKWSLLSCLLSDHAVSSDFILISFLIKIPFVGEIMSLCDGVLFLLPCFSDALQSIWPGNGNAVDFVLLA